MLRLTISRISVPRLGRCDDFETQASTPAPSASPSHSSSIRIVSSTIVESRRLFAALADALEAVLRVLHLVDQHDVRLALPDGVADRAASVDLAEHLQTRGVLQREPDGLDHERAISDDHDAVHWHQSPSEVGRESAESLCPTHWTNVWDALFLPRLSACPEVGAGARTGARVDGRCSAARRYRHRPDPGCPDRLLQLQSGGYFAGAPALVAAELLVLIAAYLALGEAATRRRGAWRSACRRGSGRLRGVGLASGAWSDAPARALPEYTRALCYLAALVFFGLMPLLSAASAAGWRTALALPIVVVCAVAFLSRTAPDCRQRDGPSSSRGGSRTRSTTGTRLGLLAGLGIVLCGHFACASRDHWVVTRAGRRGSPAAHGHALLHLFARSDLGNARGHRRLRRSRARRAGCSRRPRHGSADGGGADDGEPGGRDHQLTEVRRGHARDGPSNGADRVRMRRRRRGPARLPPAGRWPPGGAWHSAPRLRRRALARRRCGRAAAGAGGVRRAACARRWWRTSTDDFKSGSGAAGGSGSSRLLSSSRQRPLGALGGRPRRASEHDHLHGSGAGTYQVCLGARRAPRRSTPRTGTRSTWRPSASSGSSALLCSASCLLVLLGGFARRVRGDDRELFAALLAAGVAWALPRSSTGCGRCPRSPFGSSRSAEPRSRDPRARPPAGPRSGPAARRQARAQGRRRGGVRCCSRCCLRGSRSLRRMSKPPSQSMHAGDCAQRALRGPPRARARGAPSRTAPRDRLVPAARGARRPPLRVNSTRPLNRTPTAGSSSTRRRSLGPPRGSTPRAAAKRALAQNPNSALTQELWVAASQEHARVPEPALCAGSASLFPRSATRDPYVFPPVAWRAPGLRSSYARATPRCRDHGRHPRDRVRGCPGGRVRRRLRRAGTRARGSTPQSRSARTSRSTRGSSTRARTAVGATARGRTPAAIAATEDEIRPTRESRAGARALLIVKWPANTTASTQ